MHLAGLRGMPRKEHRGGSAYAHLMRPAASRLTPEQMRDVAVYYPGSLPK